MQFSTHFFWSSFKTVAIHSITFNYPILQFFLTCCNSAQFVTICNLARLLYISESAHICFNISIQHVSVLNFLFGELFLAVAIQLNSLPFAIQRIYYIFPIQRAFFLTFRVRAYLFYSANYFYHLQFSAFLLSFGFRWIVFQHFNSGRICFNISIKRVSVFAVLFITNVLMFGFSAIRRTIYNLPIQRIRLNFPIQHIGLNFLIQRNSSYF